MFVKVFTSILDSTLAEDYLTRHVFEDLLKLADRDGNVDMTAAAIARRTAVPIEIVTRAIEKLSQPDPESRSTDEDGRRLLPLDAHRSWGWQIVNYLNYRSIRDEDDRRAYFRERKRIQRSRPSQKSTDVQDMSNDVQDICGQSNNVTYADADAEIDISSNADTSAGDISLNQLELVTPASSPAASKSSALVKVWDHYILKTERNPKTYEFTAARKRKGLARLDECLKKTAGDLDKAAELMKVAIDAIAISDWHMGRDAKTNGKFYREWDDHLFGSYRSMEKWWNV